MEILPSGTVAVAAGNSMKKAVIFIISVLMLECAQAQTNGLSFQWHGQTMGVDFELTNLAADVKGAIRDDVAYALSLIPSTNVTFEALTPTSSNYGKYAGFVMFSHATPINYCGGVLCYYKNSGGKTVLHLSPETCAKYAAAVALTNQYAAAMGALSNRLQQAMIGYNVAAMTLAEKRNFFWNPPLMEKIETMKGVQFEQFLNDSIPDVNDPIHGVWPFPSILRFKVSSELIDGGNPPMLSCDVIGGNLDTGDIDTFTLVYVDGIWRFCPPCF